MTEIPEHLLRRSRERRERLNDTRQATSDLRRTSSTSIATDYALNEMLVSERGYISDVASMSITDDKDEGVVLIDPTDIGAIIGVSVAESCSLDALKIRANVINKLTGEDESVPSVRIQREDIVDMTFELGDKRVVGSEVDRQVTALGFQDGIGLYAWMNNPKDGVFGRDKEHNDSSVEEETIYFGFAKHTRYNRQLFVPVIKSSAINGCHFVIPQGSEVDKIAFNQTDVLSKLASIVEQNGVLDSDRHELMDLLRVIDTVLATSPEGAQLQMFIERQLRKLPEEYRVVEALFSGQLDSLRRTTRNLLPYDESGRRRFEVVGNTYETDHLVEGDTHQLEYFLEDAGLSFVEGELPAKHFILWNGLDPDIYPGADRMFPRFSLKQSEFGDIQLVFYENGDFVSGREPTEKETKFLLRLLNKKLTTPTEGIIENSREYEDNRSARLRNRVSTRLIDTRIGSRGNSPSSVRRSFTGISYPPKSVWRNPR